MNKKTLLLSVFSVFTYFAVTSYSGGPAHNGVGNLTGGPGASGTCGNGGCHNGGSGVTTGSIEIRRKDWGASSSAINYYEAGKTYIVTIKGTNATLSHFGFQFVAQKNSDNTPAGTYPALSGNVHGFPHTAPTIIEQNAPIAKTAGNYEVSFDWNAPSTGIGQVNLYAIINAVNNNTVVTGDKPSGMLTLSLNDLTSVGEVSREVVFKAYPNPVQNMLTLDLTKAEAGTYIVQAYSVSGGLVTRAEIEIDSRVYTGVISTADWKPGLYFVRIQKDGEARVIPVLKQ